MKVLLDKNLPQDLRHELPGHDVYTVAFMGWAGLENGKLLAAAGGAGFDAVITKDLGIGYQQNQSALPVGVVVLRAPSNAIEVIRPLVPSILEALARLSPRSIAWVGG